MIFRTFGGALLVALFAQSAVATADIDGPISISAEGWSQAPTRWTITSNGSIIDVRGDGQTLMLPMTLATRKTIAAPERYRRVQQLLAPVRAWMRTGKALPCKLSATDASFGQIRWGALPVLPFYTGCGDPETRPVIDSIIAASAQIGEWVKNEPVVARRELKTSEDYRAASLESGAR